MACLTVVVHMHIRYDNKHIYHSGDPLERVQYYLILCCGTQHPLSTLQYETSPLCHFSITAGWVCERILFFIFTKHTVPQSPQLPKLSIVNTKVGIEGTGLSATTVDINFK